MPIKVLAIWVLTGMELFSVIEYVWAYYTKKHSKVSKKVAIANRVITIVEWKFAAVMCIKVFLENELGIPALLPAMWIADMLLMNFAVVELMVKYVFMRSKNNNNSKNKR